VHNDQIYFKAWFKMQGACNNYKNTRVKSQKRKKKNRWLSNINMVNDQKINLKQLNWRRLSILVIVDSANIYNNATYIN